MDRIDSNAAVILERWHRLTGIQPLCLLPKEIATNLQLISLL